MERDFLSPKKSGGVGKTIICQRFRQKKLDLKILWIKIFPWIVRKWSLFYENEIKDMTKMYYIVLRYLTSHQPGSLILYLRIRLTTWGVVTRGFSKDRYYENW